MTNNYIRTFIMQVQLDVITTCSLR